MSGSLQSYCLSPQVVNFGASQDALFFSGNEMHRSRLTCVSVWLLLATASIPTAGQADTPPAVAAHFELRVAPAAGESPPQTWLLWREPDRVETRLPSGDGEIWRRDTRGDVYYQRLFHPQRRLIEYTPVDLRALGAVRGWPRLTHLIDPALLGGELKRIGNATALGRPAVRYRGRVRGIQHDVLWLVHERLPARMRIDYGDRTMTLRLGALYPIDQSPWARADTTAYLVTDYADIGDHEADPFLRRLLDEAGPAHAH